MKTKMVDSRKFIRNSEYRQTSEYKKAQRQKVIQNCKLPTTVMAVHLIVCKLEVWNVTDAAIYSIVIANPKTKQFLMQYGKGKIKDLF